MKKRILSFILALILCLSIATPVLAANGEYVYDVVSVLSEEELTELNEQADAIYQEYALSIYFVLTRGTNTETLQSQIEAFYTDAGGAQDGIAMAIDKVSGAWDIYTSGVAEAAIGTEQKEELFNAFNEPDTWYDGVHDFIQTAEEILVPYITGEATVIIPPPEETQPVDVGDVDQEGEGVLLRFVDEAGLLTDSQKEALEDKLADIRERQNVDVVIVTCNSLNGEDVEDYSGDFYDENGYGIGPNRDGVILLISMEERDWVITSTGFGQTAINEAARKHIADQIVGELSDGNYAFAFTLFVDQCDQLLTQAKSGDIYKTPFAIGKNILISLAISLCIALIVAFTMKGKLKSVKKQSAAAVYVKNGSLNLTRMHEHFLYHTVTRTPIPKNTTSSGGSASGSSSRGSTSGKF